MFAERIKLSDHAEQTVTMQQERDGVVRWSAWLDRTFMQDHDEWFAKQQKSMLKFFGLLWAIGALASIGAVIGVIYFVFWCLKHFGVIGG